jgi:hypothetical protein
MNTWSKAVTALPRDELCTRMSRTVRSFAPTGTDASGKGVPSGSAADPVRGVAIIATRCGTRGHRCRPEESASIKDQPGHLAATIASPAGNPNRCWIRSRWSRTSSDDLAEVSIWGRTIMEPGASGRGSTVSLGPESESQCSRIILNKSASEPAWTVDTAVTRCCEQATATTTTKIQPSRVHERASCTRVPIGYARSH